MAEITFTERELGFINECAIDKKGVLVEMPANPFPSLYRKGVIAKTQAANRKSSLALQINAM